MPALFNRTPFAAIDFFAVDAEARDALVVCVAGTFDLPRAGGPADAVPEPADEQPPPPLVDVWSGPPGQSSLRHDSQAVLRRPGTDVVLWGRAVPPRGRPVPQLHVSLRAGPVVRRALVSGNRVWRRGPHGLVPSDPVPFETMPLVYERAFGGAAAPPHADAPAPFEPRNPIGLGFYATERDAAERPLPNIEDETALLRAPLDRPPPFGFGPVPRHFQPRAGHAGTYDERWVEQRAPLWPADFDERFFQGAPPGAAATPHLRGGEPVVIEGVSADGPLRFMLPLHRLAARATVRGRRTSRPMLLDGVSIDTDEGRLTLFWRVSFPAHRALSEYTETLVRYLRPGEDPS